MSEEQGTYTPQTDRSDSPPPRRRFPVLLRVLLPVVVLAIGAGVAIWLLESRPKARPRPQTPNATLVEVQTFDFGPQQITVTAMGTVQAAREVELKPQVGGEVVEISPNLVPGGHFRRGETLLRLDPADYLLSVRQLQSTVAQAEAELQLEQGNQLVARKEFALLGEAVSTEEEALMLRQPQLDSLQAALETAQARLEQARLDLARTTLHAPFNAVVTSRAANLGSRVTAGSTVATLVGTDAYWVEVPVPTSQLRSIRIPHNGSGDGSPVRIYDTSAWGEGIFRRGQVIRLAADLEEQGRLARLVVRIDDPLGRQKEPAETPILLLGAYVRVEIEGVTLPAVAALDRAILRDGSSVWVMNAENRLEIRPVTIAFKERDRVLISAGFAPGERLVVSDLPAPVAGMPLRLAENETSPDPPEKGGTRGEKGQQP